MLCVNIRLTLCYKSLGPIYCTDTREVWIIMSVCVLFVLGGEGWEGRGGRGGGGSRLFHTPSLAASFSHLQMQAVKSPLIYKQRGHFVSYEYIYLKKSSFFLSFFPFLLSHLSEKKWRALLRWRSLRVFAPNDKAFSLNAFKGIGLRYFYDVKLQRGK